VRSGLRLTPGRPKERPGVFENDLTPVREAPVTVAYAPGTILRVAGDGDLEPYETPIPTPEDGRTVAGLASAETLGALYAKLSGKADSGAPEDPRPAKPGRTVAA
jgi:hypothetical protein